MILMAINSCLLYKCMTKFSNNNLGEYARCLDLIISIYFNIIPL